MKPNRSHPRLWTMIFPASQPPPFWSAIGGEAMNPPISLLVFDKTQSTLLSAVILVCGMLPDMILPILIAPLIDKGGKKKWIIGLGYSTGLHLRGPWDCGLQAMPLPLGLYVIFTLIVGTVSVFLPSGLPSLVPDLIPAEPSKKAIPSCHPFTPWSAILMAPVAAFLYERVSMGALFCAVAGLTLVSVVVEGCIREVQKPRAESYTLRQYRSDIREGFAYLKKKKAFGISILT